jgi:hypothetical protein
VCVNCSPHHRFGRWKLSVKHISNKETKWTKSRRVAPDHREGTPMNVNNNGDRYCLSALNGVFWHRRFTDKDHLYELTSNNSPMYLPDMNCWPTNTADRSRLFQQHCCHLVPSSVLRGAISTNMAHCGVVLYILVGYHIHVYHTSDNDLLHEWPS